MQELANRIGEASWVMGMVLAWWPVILITNLIVFAWIVRRLGR